jgi:hypothetical protein
MTGIHLMDFWSKGLDLQTFIEHSQLAFHSTSSGKFGASPFESSSCSTTSNATGRQSRAPANVVQIEKGKKIADMLSSGELAAGIGVEVDHPDVMPLIPNALEAGLRAVRERGHYPINHMIVIKDELPAAHPNLAADVFNVFAESKHLYIDRLKAGEAGEETGEEGRPRWH